jgi:hypothetical protein
VRLSEHGVAVGDALDRPVETIPNVWVQPGKAAVGGESDAQSGPAGSSRAPR